jgi:hypothetical protein
MFVNYFDYWFDGIVGTSELIADDEALRRTWVSGDHSITSIHYYDELFEQLAGDLHLDESLTKYADVLKGFDALDDLQRFATALHTLDAQIEANPDLQNPAMLLGSSEWKNFQVAAKRVLNLPIVKRFRRNGNTFTGMEKST